MDMLTQVLAMNGKKAPDPLRKKTQRSARIVPGSNSDRLLKLMTDDTEWTAYRVRDELGVSISTARSAINRLVSFGWVEVVGTRKSLRDGKTPEFLYRRAQ